MVTAITPKSEGDCQCEPLNKQHTLVAGSDAAERRFDRQERTPGTEHRHPARGVVMTWVIPPSYECILLLQC